MTAAIVWAWLQFVGLVLAGLIVAGVLLAIIFAAVNHQPPAVTLALPTDVVRLLMHDIGLGARESGLSAMIARLNRSALHPPAPSAGS